MLDDEPTGGTFAPPTSTNDTSTTNDTNTITGASAPAPGRRATRKAAAPQPGEPTGDDAVAAPAKAAKRATKRGAKKTAPAVQRPGPANPDEAAASRTAGQPAAGDSEPAKKVARRGTKKAAPAAQEPPTDAAPPAQVPPSAEASAQVADIAPAKKATKRAAKKAAPTVAFTPPAMTFVAPGEQITEQPAPRGRAAKQAVAPDAEPSGDQTPEARSVDAGTGEPGDDGASRRRRRGRRGRGRGRGGEDEVEETAADGATGDGAVPASEGQPAAEQGDRAGGHGDVGDEQPGSDAEGGTRRRRRRRRGANGDADGDGDTEDAPGTVVKTREPRKRASKASGGKIQDEVQGVRGSTRLEAKRQRRRDGRDNGRKRPAIVTEAEFLARRESVERVMAVRQVDDRTQIVVLEDGVLVEHYVTKASSASYAGNIYLGRVQNVLPSMEAAFIDIGKGRNAVLYAGEVNWDAAGLGGKPRRIEEALKSGQPVLVQVTKDPIGHKGARLTSQISLPGRFLVYVPEGSMTGISRRLPETERKRLKDILKKVIPEDAGVIIRTAAEGATEDQLTRDVQRLRGQWDVLKKKADSSSGSAPTMLYEEPDLAIRVVRDVFNEDFAQLIVSGEEEWETVKAYVDNVAPDLADRLAKHPGEANLFADLRVDEQLAKALDNKVFLPSGGSLVIDRTEAMTVVDVNTGKFTGQGGNLEETVTRNNLEAAEEIVRQLRLRDVGGIIVVDFIDMVLEANRDLVLRRLTECLGRDRTKHQVAEVTSLGLVQMTRQRVGQGLLESFSETCETCGGRGVIVHSEPVTGPEDKQNGGRPDDPPIRKHGRAAKPTAEPPVRSNGELHKIHEASLRRAQLADEQADAGAEYGAVEMGAATGAASVETPGSADEPDEDFSDATEQGSSAEPMAGVLGAEDVTTEPAPRRRRRAASRPAGPPV